MKVRVLLSACVSSALLAGCSTMPQAPLVYASKIVVGLDASQDTAMDQLPSFHLGVKTVDVAYVPVAVAEKSSVTTATTTDDSKQKEKEIGKVKIVGGTNAHATGTDTDAYSVFGSFDGRGSASWEKTTPAAGAGTDAIANTTPVTKTTGSLAMGRMFSTGIAAQTLAEAVEKQAAHEVLLQCYATASGLPNPPKQVTKPAGKVEEQKKTADADKKQEEPTDPKSSVLKSCKLLADAQVSLLEAKKALIEAKKSDIERQKSKP